jgi:hypothetical protein
MFLRDILPLYLGYISQSSTFIIFVVVIVSVSNNHKYKIVPALVG